MVSIYEDLAARGLPWRALVVFERASRRPIGTASINPVDELAPSDITDVELGWNLARHVWGRGYATEMGHGLISTLSDSEPRLRRVWASVDPGNHPLDLRVRSTGNA